MGSQQYGALAACAIQLLTLRVPATALTQRSFSIAAKEGRYSGDSFWRSFLAILYEEHMFYIQNMLPCRRSPRK